MLEKSLDANGLGHCFWICMINFYNLLCQLNFSCSAFILTRLGKHVFLCVTFRAKAKVSAPQTYRRKKGKATITVSWLTSEFIEKYIESKNNIIPIGATIHQAHDVGMMSYRRRCNVMCLMERYQSRLTKHRNWTVGQLKKGFCNNFDSTGKSFNFKSKNEKKW